MSANKINVLNRLSAEQKAALDKQNEIAADLYAPGQSYQEMRVAYEFERKWWNQGGPDMATTNDLSVPTTFGPVRVRQYIPQSVADSTPAIVFIHGGGYVLGSVDTHDRICRYLADQTQYQVFSVDYTLSPEAKNPQPVEESAQVVQYLRDNASNLNIDPNDLGFAGDSGGAGLSLATYYYLKEHGQESGIRAMLLFYGWYGLRDSTSIRRLGGPWDGLTEEDFDFYKNLYFSDPSDADSPYVNMLGNDLHGFPPAYILAAELDPLHDDSATLADIYSDYGIKHQYVEVPGVLHGFIHHGRIVNAANQALIEAAKFYLSINTKE